MKNYRKIELKDYILLNILIIILFSGWIDKINDMIINSNIDYLSLIKEIVSLPFIYVIIFIADTIIPSTVKEKIVFLFDDAPGSRIFTKIKNGKLDNRISVHGAQKKYDKEIRILDKITDKNERAKESNSIWYSIYLKFKKEEQVTNSQTDYLLLRDMCSHTICILAMYCVLSLSFHETITWNIVLIIIAEYIIIMLAARIKANRFVSTVIALDINEKKENK